MKNNRSKNSQSKLKSNREKGFTLIEVLVAISILCFGLLGVAAMQASAIQGNALASDVTEATVWASEHLERLMRTAVTNYDDSDLSDRDGDGDAGLTDTGAADADWQEMTPDNRFTINWNVSVDAVATNTKTINVIVTWNGQFGAKQVSIRQIITQV
jgi:type IV pilus assembly protein PilV